MDALDVPIDLFAAKALLYCAADWLGAVPRYSSLVGLLGTWRWPCCCGGWLKDMQETGKAAPVKTTGAV